MSLALCRTRADPTLGRAESALIVDLFPADDPRCIYFVTSSYSDCLCWDSTGTSLIISNASDRLLKVVLPESFGHSNLASFTRKLCACCYTTGAMADTVSYKQVN